MMPSMELLLDAHLVWDCLINQGNIIDHNLGMTYPSHAFDASGHSMHHTFTCSIISFTILLYSHQMHHTLHHILHHTVLHKKYTTLLHAIPYLLFFKTLHFLCVYLFMYLLVLKRAGFSYLYHIHSIIYNIYLSKLYLATYCVHI